MEAGSPSSDYAAETDASDETLVARARDGDGAALDRLLRRHHPELARLLWRFARQPAELDDLVQETFLRVLRALPKWRPDQPFVHWLRRVAVNVGRDHHRRSAVRRRWLADPASSPASAEGGAPPSPEAVDPAPDPAARAAADEIKTLLATLPADDRTVLVLHHLEGWDFAEIGRQLGWPAPLARLRAFRARRRLRALLESSPSNPFPVSA